MGRTEKSLPAWAGAQDMPDRERFAPPLRSCNEGALGGTGAAAFERSIVS